MPNATEKEVSTKVNYLWLGVPGFYIKNVKNRVLNKFMDTPFLNDKWKGMLVPFYDVNNNLIRFQIRLDEPALEHVSVEEVEIKDLKKETICLLMYRFLKVKKTVGIVIILLQFKD